MSFDSPEFSPEPDQQTLQIYNPSGYTLPVRTVKLQFLQNEIEIGENVKFSLLEVVYVNEDEILKINKEHLSKDYITDIITFRYDEENPHALEATLYCCAPRIAEQSAEFCTSQEQEFYRVFIHGLLHLAGYNDQNEFEKEKMTELENHYLQSVD
jgi:probable rRNA maturation factor